MVRSKNLAQLQGVIFGVFILPVPQHPGDLPRQARRQCDEAPAVLPQQGQVDAGLDIKALRPGHGHHVGEVAIALLVLAQQHQMAALGVEFMDLVKPGAASGRHIHLTADDGLDSLRLAGAVKIDDAVHHAVVCDGTGILPHGLHDLRQIPDAARAVQQAVFRMHM